MNKVRIDLNKCICCGVCGKVCPMNLIDVGDDGRPYITKEKDEYCFSCGQCTAFCPSLAIHPKNTLDESEAKPLNSKANKDDISGYLKARRSIRNFAAKQVSRDTIIEVFDVVRYAPSAGNAQSVKWVVVHDTIELKKIIELAIDWLKALKASDSPMKNMLMPDMHISQWEKGIDSIMRGAPHLVVACTPASSPIGDKDGVISLAYLDVTLPAFGLGGFWAGFMHIAAENFEPVKRALKIPEGYNIRYCYGFGYPAYKVKNIPERSPASIVWL